MPTRYKGTPAETRALDAYIALMRAGQSIGERVHGELRAAGLTVGQFGVLEALLHKGPLPTGDIARAILVSAANCTTIVDHLEERGLVLRERGEEDRRRVVLALTAEGRRLVSGLFPAHAARMAREFSRLTVKEQEELRRLCRKLGRADDEPAVGGKA
jgi:MarR family 2-MHQ and catechol resistance regulon transcriptional repressor